MVCLMSRSESETTKCFSLKGLGPADIPAESHMAYLDWLIDSFTFIFFSVGKSHFHFLHFP